MVEMSKSVCIPDNTEACKRVCRLGPGGHKLVHDKLVCARYKLACILGKWAYKLVLGSTAFELDIPACTPACTAPVYTPACTPACTPGRRSSLADGNRVLDQQQRQQSKRR